MKKILLVAIASLAFSTGAFANNVVNPPVEVNGNVGSVQISQCASVAGNCNNPEMNINFNGGVDTVITDGKAIVIKGKDGVNGKDGINGKDGVDGKNGTNGKDGLNGKDGINGTDGAQGIQGIQGEKGNKGDKGDKGDTGATGQKGDTGSAGKDGLNGSDGKDGKDGINGTNGTDGVNGTNGKDGINGTNGKDADMTIVNKNTSDITDLQNVKADKSTVDGVSQKVDANAAKQHKVDAKQNQRITQVERNKVDKSQYTQDQQETDARINSTNNRVTHVERSVQSLEQSTNQRFANMDKRINENRKVASAGIAGAGAMANIPTVGNGNTVSVGAGIGGYDGEQAVAVGVSVRLSDNVVTKVSVSTNTQSEVLWGAGVGVEW